MTQFMVYRTDTLSSWVTSSQSSQSGNQQILRLGQIKLICPRLLQSIKILYRVGFLDVVLVVVDSGGGDGGAGGSSGGVGGVTVSCVSLQD